MRKTRSKTLWLGALVALACGEEVETGPTDGGRPGGLDAGTGDAIAADAGASVRATACANDARPRRERGPGGGLASDAVQVFAVDQDDGARLAGITIQLDRGGEQFVAPTREDGCVRFEGTGLDGGYDVHAFGDGWAYRSHFGQRAAQITLGLGPQRAREETRPLTRVSGTVTNLEVASPGTSVEGAFGFVSPLESNFLEPNPPELLRSNGIESRVVLSLPSFGLVFSDFSVDVFSRRSRGVWLEAGRYRVRAPEYRPNEYEPTHLGLLTGLDFSRQEIPEQRLELTHPLDQTLRIVLPEDRAQLGQRDVFGLINVAGGQMVRGSVSDADDEITENEVVLAFPARTGALAEARYGTWLRYRTPLGEAPVVMSTLFFEGDGLELRPGPLPLAHAAPAVEGRSLSVETFEDAELVFFTLEGADRELWRITGRATPEVARIELPVPPEGFEDPLFGELRVLSEVYSYVEGFDPDDYEGLDLRSQRVASTWRDRDVVRFDAPDPNPFACGDDVAPAPRSGGFGGGPIDGRLVLHALDDTTREPLGEIPFLVEHPAGRIAGQVDRNGCADLRDPELKGPVTVHLFPRGRPFHSFAGLDAAVQAHLVIEAFQPRPSPDTAVFEGRFEAFDQLPSPTAQTAQIIVAGPLARSAVSPDLPDQPRRDDFLFDQNAGYRSLAFGWDLDTYRLVVDPDDTLGVVFLGGTFRPGDGSFETTHVGVIPSVSVEAGDTLTDLDAVRLVPRDRELVVNVTSPDLGPTSVTTVMPLLFFPDGGVFYGWRGVGSDANPYTARTLVPAATGDFEGVSYGAFVNRRIFEGSINVYSFRVVEGDSGLVQDVTLPDIPLGLARTDRTVTALLDPELTDYAEVRLFREEADGSFPATWIAHVPDPTSSLSFTFPAVPEGLTDPLEGTVGTTVASGDRTPGFEIDEATPIEARAATRAEALVAGFLDP